MASFTTIPLGSLHQGPPSNSTAPNSRLARSYPQSRKPPSVNFMMLPLCTSVTLLRLLAMAYSRADRIRRSLPSRDTGLIPNADDCGNRTFLNNLGNVRSEERRV